MRSVWLSAGLSARALETLAKGDAWGSVALNRRGALWAAKGLGPPPLPLFAAADRPNDQRRAQVPQESRCADSSPGDMVDQIDMGILEQVPGVASCRALP